MADNYLEKRYAEYEKRKAAWERRKKGVKRAIDTLHRPIKPEDESL